MVGVYILAVSVFSCALVGSLVISRGLHDRKTIIYGLLTLSLLTLCIMNFFAVSLKENQIYFVRGVMASTTVAMYLIYVLIMELKDRKRKISYINNKLFYATAIMFVVDFTSLLFSGVIPGEPPKPIPNFGIIFFFGLYIVTLVIGIWQLRKDISQATSLNERRRYTLLIAGIVPIVFLAPLTSFVMPNYLGISHFVVATPLYVFCFVAFVGYAIVRHGMFDIRQATVRTMAYVLSLVFLAGVYYFMAYAVSLLLFNGSDSEAGRVSPISIFLALVLALVFQPIKRFFDRLTNSIFYRDEYKPEEFFAQLSNLLTSTTDLRGLLRRASEQIATTFKAEQAIFLLEYTNGTKHHMTSGTDHHETIPMYDVHMLDAYVQKNGSGLVLTEVLPANSDVRRMLVSHKIGLFMPLKNNGSVIGYLLLGSHLSRNYSKRDIKVLNTIGNELVIAIQNAVSLHEVKEINATLQQRIDVATKELRSSNSQLRHLDEVKDEFMSMASHQLRTPLTSIKGYLSMVLEEDMGKITAQQRTVLEEAFNSSERMVRLISDFLNVSRLQTGKFIIEKNQADIVNVTRGEIDGLQMIAGTHDLKLVFKTHEKELAMNIDEGKIRQVIMNFVDNAIYYSRPNSTINVTLERLENEIAFKVIDTGIGVPADEQEMLFNKFFRAKNARQQRPDGTGVGCTLPRR